MTLGELLKKVDIVEAAADMGTQVSGVCFDTKTLGAGEIFVAVRGYQHDGHMFIGEAAAKGAACVICESIPDVQTPYVLVPDTHQALALVSAAWFGFPADELKIIGVTGTNGKTTVTSLIKQVIENCTGDKAGLIGTNGNKIGNEEFPAERTTPSAYEIQELLSMMVKSGCLYVVMEVSSHSLAQGRVYGIEFEVGVYTNLSPEHLDYHASMEEYAETKSLLFKNSRNAVINIDDAYAFVMRKETECPVTTYSVNDDSADLVAKNIKLFPDRVNFGALSIGSLNRVELGMPGMFTVYNALAVIAATMLLGFETDRIVSALKICKGVKGRAEVVPVNKDYTVLIDYAHTPAALEGIIKAAREFSPGRVVTLFGCGGDRDRKKRPLMGAIAAENSDYVIVTSDNPRTEDPAAIISDILEGMKNTATPYRVIENRKEAIHWALGSSKTDDVLILAGKGHETYQIIGNEKKHFDERIIIEEYLNNRK